MILVCLRKSKIGMNQEVELLGDKGYQGVKNIHTNSRTPLKKPKNKKLSQAEKNFNRQLAKDRIIIENIHRSLIYLEYFHQDIGIEEDASD